MRIGQEKPDAQPEPRLPTSPRGDDGTRFTLIDGLRGIAALSVLLFHYHHAIEGRPGFALFPGAASAVLSKGWLGVEIFFVISGFVIAHSIRAQRITPRYIARFALRRSIRLDPPYWATIAFVLVMTGVAHHLHPDRNAFPAVKDILANMFYVAGILNRPFLLDIFWTLCLEVQFYLLFVLLVALAQRIGRDTRSADLWTAFLVCGVAAASVFFQIRRLDPHGWFIAQWYGFATGAICYLATQRRIAISFLVLILIGDLSAACFRSTISPVATALCAIVIAFAGFRGKLSIWLRHGLFHYLGKISYSLYLTHSVFIGAFFNYAHALSRGSKWMSFVWFWVAIALGIGVWHLLYRIVENPS